MQSNGELIRLLGEINPKHPYGTEVFNALARLTVSVAIEAVCLRFCVNQISLRPYFMYDVDVYLTLRAPHEEYAGQWHCPGSFKRPGEQDNDVLYRLMQEEFSLNFLSQKFVGKFDNPSEKRGHIISLIYLCEMEEKGAGKGKWFPVNKLPENTVLHHQNRIIPVAVGYFLANLLP